MILAALLLPTLSKAKERAHRIACLNNEKQMGTGSFLYAADDDRGALTGTYDDGDDDLKHRRQVVICRFSLDVERAPSAEALAVSRNWRFINAITIHERRR